MNTAFTIYRDQAGEYRWKAADEDGRVIAGSAGAYATADLAGRCLFRILRANQVGCSLQYDCRTPDYSALVEGVHTE